MEESVYNKEYIFLENVSQDFKLDLWFPQTYLRGTRVLDVIGRLKCIIDELQEEKTL